MTCRCGVTTPRPLCYFCMRSSPRTRPVCGAMMTLAAERCARRLGHGTEHRTAYALENARRMRSGRGLRRLVAT